MSPALLRGAPQDRIYYPLERKIHTDLYAHKIQGYRQVHTIIQGHIQALTHTHTPATALTLLCRTTTLWGSALSHVSMALQMLQIFSRAGVWRSGQPNSSTYGPSHE